MPRGIGSLWQIKVSSTRFTKKALLLPFFSFSFSSFFPPFFFIVGSRHRIIADMPASISSAVITTLAVVGGGRGVAWRD